MEFDGIEFAEEYQWDASRLAVVFWADVDRERIECRISRSALVDYYHTEDTKEQALASFEKYQDDIYNLAESLIREDQFDDNGQIFIHLETCENYNL